MAKRREGIACSDDLRVAFGEVLDDGRPVHGGAVKLLSLRDGLPCDERCFSILYAVSSCPPLFAEPLFKLCRQLGIKIVWNQNGVGYPAWAGAESERFNAPMRRLRAMADFVVYQSRFCRESAERFLGACQTASAILFNPVDAERFAPAADSDFDRPLRLLAAGTHGTRDRVVNVLEALAILRKSGVEASLTVAGSFQWKGGELDFERMVETLGLQKSVRRIGRFSHASAAEMYQAHDLLVHPKYMDPCPTVVLEAMACGLPVVGSASGGMPEMVGESCGVLVPAPLDWDNRHTPRAGELADAIRHVASRRKEMSLAARRCVEERFAVGPWVEAHREIFVELLQ